MADPENHSHNGFAGRGVYLLDDHEVVRRGLRQLIESNGLSIAGESGSAREAVRRIPALGPELVILDDDLPDGSGADVCHASAAADPGIRCVLMTADTDETVLIDSILAGARGPFSLLGPQGLDESLLSLSRQEMTAAIGLGKGLSNRQISQEMSIRGGMKGSRGGVCTLSTLWASDRVVLVPDWAGFPMFPRESSDCGGENAVRVPPRARVFPVQGLVGR